MNLKNILETYSSNLDKGEKEAAKLAVKVADTEAFDKINGLIEETTFERRNYGGGQFYVWAYHPILPPISDPWPASRFPRAVLFVMFAEILFTR